MRHSLQKSLAALSFATVGLLLAPLTAVAQAFPSQPITLVVPYPPGAVSDALARIIQPGLSAKLGQPVVVENRPGAAGAVGTNEVARAEPDGYKLLLTVNAPIVMVPWMQNVRYDSSKDLAAVSSIAATYLTLSVRSDSPIKTIADVVRLAKEQPGKLTFASAGIGSAHHIAGELLNKNAGIKINHIPYQGGAPAVTDLAGGHVDMSFGTVPSVSALVASGQLRIVALAEKRRIGSLPDVPTINETIPGVETSTWLGIVAPKDTPPAILKTLNEAVAASVQPVDVVDKIRKLGMEIELSTPEAFSKRINDDLMFWKDAIEKAGIPKT